MRLSNGSTLKQRSTRSLDLKLRTNQGRKGEEERLASFCGCTLLKSPEMALVLYLTFISKDV